MKPKFMVPIRAISIYFFIIYKKASARDAQFLLKIFDLGNEEVENSGKVKSTVTQATFSYFEVILSNPVGQLEDLVFIMASCQLPSAVSQLLSEMQCLLKRAALPHSPYSQRTHSK